MMVVMQDTVLTLVLIKVVDILGLEQLQEIIYRQLITLPCNQLILRLHRYRLDKQQQMQIPDYM